MLFDMALVNAVGMALLVAITGSMINLRSAEAAELSFPTSKSDAAFVRVSPRDPRYFELSDGTPYVPIGLNMIAPPGDKGLAGMEDWMTQLSTNGGNYIRVWLGNPFFDVEHAHSGEYDEAKAERIQTLLTIAARKGIRVKLCLEHFRNLDGGRQAWASKPLHLVANRGTATNMNDFFDGKARSRSALRAL